MAPKDDARTRAIMHGLATYRSDAEWYARQISVAMSMTANNNDEKQAIDRLLSSLEDKFYTQVDLCVEILLGF
jgi:homoserine acetyltransferase